MDDDLGVPLFQDIFSNSSFRFLNGQDGDDGFMEETRFFFVDQNPMASWFHSVKDYVKLRMVDPTLY